MYNSIFSISKRSINTLLSIQSKQFARNIIKPINQNNNFKKPFNPQLSKYKLDPELSQEQIKETKNSIPGYLKKEFNNTLQTKPILDKFSFASDKFKTSENKSRKEEKYLKKQLQPGKKTKIEKTPFQKKPKKQVLLKEKRERKNVNFEQRKYELLSKSDKLLLNNTDWSINRNNLEYIGIERKKISNELVLAKTKRKEVTNRVFNPEDFEKEFSIEERLSKRLSKMGVCSRRHAEKMISLGLIKVDGKVADSNLPVNAESDIRVFTKNGYIVPVKEGVKCWVFYKPQGYVCTAKDVRNRPTIFQLFKSIGFTSYNHLIPIGNLDFSSEGLVLLTNSGELARSLEKNKTIERSYKVRVFGRMFSDKYIHQIRNGLNIRNKHISFWAELIKKQNTNTWLNIKTKNNSIVDIRHVFRKLSLRVNRLIRVSYGPFTLQNSNQPGYINEVEIPRDIGNYLYDEKRHTMNDKIEKIDRTRLLINSNKDSFEEKVIRLAESKKHRLLKEAEEDSERKSK